MKAAELTRKSVEVANQAILDKGYSIFDFEITKESAKDILKITRKSQKITIYYEKISNETWLKQFQNDLEMYLFG